jgi:hypothetical protein
MGTRVLVILGVVVFLGAVIALAMRGDNVNRRVLQLEEESALNYSMAKSAMERLGNLCTHFKDGCTKRYGK